MHIRKVAISSLPDKHLKKQNKKKPGRGNRRVMSLPLLKSVAMGTAHSCAQYSSESTLWNKGQTLWLRKSVTSAKQRKENWGRKLAVWSQSNAQNNKSGCVNLARLSGHCRITAKWWIKLPCPPWQKLSKSIKRPKAIVTSPTQFTLMWLSVLGIHGSGLYNWNTCVDAHHVIKDWQPTPISLS